MSDDQIAVIAAGLSPDGVYIAPQLTATIDASEQAQIAANVAKSPTPIFVIGIPLNYKDQYGGDGEQVAALVIDRINKDGSYLVAGKDGAGDLAYVQNGPGNQDLFEATWVARQQAPKDQGQQLVIATRLIANDTVAQEYDKESAKQDANRSHSSTATPSGQDGRSPTGGIVFGGVTVVIVIAVAAAMLRRRGRGHGARAALDVPRSVLGRVAKARNQNWRHQAQTELIDLGERIDKAHLDPTAPTEAWQAALDHYDAASRVYDRSTEPADTVGVLVLLDRGNAALDAALAGRAFVPETPCYLNPLHGPATKKTVWGQATHRVTIPTCADCDRAIKQQTEPDVLDVTVDGRSVHYFDSKIEPWASTGYGALNPDLVTALSSS